MKFVQLSSSVEIITGKAVSVADLRRIAKLANRLPLHKAEVCDREEFRDTSGQIIQKKGVELVLDREGEGKDPGSGNEWRGRDNTRWVAADLMKIIQDAGFKTCVWSLGDGIIAQAVTDDGENIEVIAECHAAHDCLAAAGLAVWAERETRGKKR